MADERIAGGSERGGVVPFDDVANVLRQSPGLGEDDAALAVGEAERVFLLFVERAAGFDGFGEDFAVLVGERERIDDDAEIVEQAGEIGFVGIVVADAFGEFAADERAAERVAPEDTGIEDPFVARNHLAEAVAEENVFNALDAQGDDRCLNGFGRFGAGVERRIGDAQELGRDGFFVGDELDDFFDRHLVGGLVEEFEEWLEHGWGGGQRAQRFDTSLHFALGYDGHGLGFPSEPGRPLRYVVVPGRWTRRN